MYIILYHNIFHAGLGAGHVAAATTPYIILVLCVCILLSVVLTVCCKRICRNRSDHSITMEQNDAYVVRRIQGTTSASVTLEQNQAYEIHQLTEEIVDEQYCTINDASREAFTSSALYEQIPQIFTANDAKESNSSDDQVLPVDSMYELISPCPTTNDPEIIVDPVYYNVSNGAYETVDLATNTKAKETTSSETPVADLRGSGIKEDCSDGHDMNKPEQAPISVD